MKKARSTMSLLCLLVLSASLLLSGCSSTLGKAAQPSPKQPAETARLTVPVTPVVRGDLKRVVTLSGKITPHAEANITAKHAGTVKSVNVEIGHKVNRDQIIIVQDTLDAALNTLASDAAFRANYEKAKTDYQIANASLKRYQVLFEQGAVSRSVLELEQQKAAAAQAALENWKNQMVSEGSPASVEILKRKQEEMLIRSPINGTVAYRQVNPGEQVNTAQLLITIVDISTLYIDCYAAELDIATLAPGLPVAVAVEATGQNYSGKITHISPTADAKTKTFPVRITIANPDERLKGGMFARVKVEPVVKPSVLIVPSAAVAENNGSYYVFVVNNDATLQYRKVQIGRREGDFTEIIAGLTEGERIAAENNSNLKDKTKIHIAGGQKPLQSTAGKGDKQ